MTPQEKKQFILDNLDKYLVDGRGNFYWKDAEENNLSYIFMPLGDAIEIYMKMSERIFQTKEDWGLDFLQDDAHNPILLYKNKKDGRIMYSPHICSVLTGRAINDYKGNDREILRLLKIWGIINEEQKRKLEKKEKELEDFIKEGERLDQETKKNIKEQEEKVRKWKEEWRNNSFKDSLNQSNNQDTNPPQMDNSNKNEKINQLESKLEQLKDQNSENQTPEQQAETQKEIEEKEKELKEIKNREFANQKISTAKNQINEFLKSHNLKTSDLPKKYHNWEEQLTKLENKEEIKSFILEINQQIKNKLEELKKEQNQKNNNNQPPISLSTKLFIGGGIVFGLITIGLGTIILIRKRRILKKSHK